MATKCGDCGHRFTNVFLRRDCPRCGEPLIKSEAARAGATTVPPADDGFDSIGFAVGMATGIPLSPTRGFSTGALIGAALHSDAAHSAPAPTPSNEDSFSGGGGSYGGGGASSSWDSSSSSSSSDSSSSYSSSSDSGSSSSGGSD